MSSLSNKKEVKRVGIYLFYDKDGIVDKYNLILLEDLKKNLDKLVIVCNGKLNVEGRKMFETITSNIIVRENVGFDVWGYKEGIESIGWDYLTKSCDELVLINYTMFGPLYPFKEMFDEMNKRDCDFWGITKHYGSKDDWTGGNMKYGYIPDFIQSFFIVIRSRMLESYEFKKYWTNMRMINSYIESMAFHEGIFTKDFIDSGFKADVYIDTEDLRETTLAPTTYSALELIKRRCPIVKRKVFFEYYMFYMQFQTGETGLETYEYIRNNLDYDTNLIWDNLLRTANQADIKRNMQANYILPLDYIKPVENKKNIKVALILHIYFTDLIEYCYHYAQAMPSHAHIYITTDSEEKKNKVIEAFSTLNVEKVEVRLIENRGRDVSALLVGCKDIIHDYDYICFAHDKKTAQIRPYSVGESFSYKCFENVLGSKAFVNNVINTFEENPRLGLLTPPPPNHGVYYSTIGLEWASNYENTVNLCKEIGLREFPMSSTKEPIAPLGTMFWFRPQAMKTLFDYDWEYKDFPKEPNHFDGTLLHAIERIYPFVAQHEGFYPGWVLSDKFAKIELTNLNYMVREINLALFQNGMYTHRNFSEVVELIRYNLFIKSSLKSKVKKLLKKVLPGKAILMLQRIRRFSK